MEKCAKLEIIVEGNGDLDFSCKGDAEALALQTIGALDFVKSWARGCLSNGKSMQKKFYTNVENSYNEDKEEKEVSKQEAVNYYLDQIEKLNQRIIAINESDERATFLIPKE